MSMFSNIPKISTPAFLTRPFSTSTKHDKATTSPQQKIPATSSGMPHAPNANRLAAGIRAIMSNQGKRLTQPKSQEARRASSLPAATTKQPVQESLPTDKELLIEFHGELQGELKTVEAKREKLEGHLQILKGIIARTKDEEKSLIEYFVQNPGTREETKGLQKALDKFEANQAALKAEVKSTVRQIEGVKAEATDLKLALANAKQFVQEEQEQSRGPLAPKAIPKAQAASPVSAMPPLPKRLTEAAQVASPVSAMPPLPKRPTQAAQVANSGRVMPQLSQSPAVPTQAAGADRKRFHALSGSHSDLSKQRAALGGASLAVGIPKKEMDVLRSFSYVQKSGQAEIRAKQLLRKLRQEKKTSSPVYAHVQAQVSQIQLEKELHRKNWEVALARLGAAKSKVS